MGDKVNSVLKEVLEKVNPGKEELKTIDLELKKFLEKIKHRIKELKLDAEIFVGGSYVKGTLIKKDIYDIDIFLRFDKKYKDEELSKLTEKILENFKNKEIIHGSRDYFNIRPNHFLFFEVIPVKKIKNPREAENITDMSCSHVKYVKTKIKSKKILDDVKIAKAFCYAKKCYGAESYIKGFSGYSLELIVYYYKGFLKFIKKCASSKEDKIIIDIEKCYKNKSEIMMEVNSSKLQSPIVLIDPTYKKRNALAALSEETFKEFQENCRNFLKNPSIKDFEIHYINPEKIKKKAKENKNEFVILKIKTEKQAGDVAGSKLFKFYKHLEKETKRYFELKDSDFDYKGNHSAICYFIAKSRREILIHGPNLKDKDNISEFKKRHKKTFTKQGRIFSKEKIDFNLRNFIRKFETKNKNQIKAMYISGVEIF
jgi:tRNA CCA-adding enzyme